MIDNRKESKTHKREENAATQGLNGRRAVSQLPAAAWAWRQAAKREDWIFRVFDPTYQLYPQALGPTVLNCVLIAAWHPDAA